MLSAERESEKRSGRHVGVAENSGEACRMAQTSAEKFEQTGSGEIKEWPHCHKVSWWQVRQSRLCQMEKEQSRLF